MMNCQKTDMAFWQLGILMDWGVFKKLRQSLLQAREWHDQEVRNLKVNLGPLL